MTRPKFQTSIICSKTALEHDADEVKEEGDQYEVICEPEHFAKLKSALDEICDEPLFCEITRIPKNQTKIEPDKVEGLDKLIEVLEDNDDVQNVYHNGERPEEA